MLRRDSYRYDSRIVFDAISPQKYIFRLGNKRVENLLRSTVAASSLRMHGLSRARAATHTDDYRVYAHKNSFCMHILFVQYLQQLFYYICAEFFVAHRSSIYSIYGVMEEMSACAVNDSMCFRPFIFIHVLHIRGRVRRNQSIFLVFRWTFCP